MSPWRKVLIGVVIIATVQIGLVLTFLYSRASGTDSALVGLPLDDGWIHLVYARNMAQSLEIAYNPGEPEVGLTSPLWVVLLSPFASLGDHEPALAAKFVSSLLAVITCLLAAWLARELYGDVAGLAAGAATALDPLLSFSASSGMEVCLATSLILATLLALARCKPLLAGLFIGLAWLARPESASLLLVIVPWSIHLLRKRKISYRGIASAVGIIALLVVPFALLCLHVSGRPLPNTFYIKGELALIPTNGLWVFLRGVLLPSVAFGFGGGLALVVIGVRWCLRQGKAHHLALLASPVVFVIAVVMSRTFTAGEAESYYFTRYLHPALALLMVLLGCGAGALHEWGATVVRRPKGSKKRRKRKARRPRRRTATIIAGVLGTLIAIALIFWLPRSIDRYSWNTRNIEEMQVAAGMWIARETPRDAVIAASDAGAVRFFGSRRVIDLMGLNYHQGIEARQQGQIPLGQVMRDESPTHLAILPSWFPNIERGGRARAVFVGRAERYTVAAARQDRFIVYEVLRR